MKIDVGAGQIGRDGVHWGTTEEGLPVLLVVSAVATLRLVMTQQETKDLGCGAIYIAMAVALETGSDAAAKPASLLVRPDGAPL